MRAFYTDHLGFTADLCLMTNGESTRLTVRSPEGTTIHRAYYESWDTAIRSLRTMLPSCTNDLTGKEI